MSHYQFHIREDGHVFEDDEGRDFTTGEAARQEAVATGAAIARDVFVSGQAQQVVIQVDRDGSPFVKVSISLDVEEQRPAARARN
jgi:hypothetical protein